MSHSKRNTSLAFFTSYERSLLRSQWGSQATRLTRDSFLPFGSCQLCLLPSQDPVACSGGELIDTTASSTRATDTSAPLQPPMKRSKIRSQCHIFCRECIIANLLSQRKELKRIERNSEAHAADAEAVDVAEDEEARQRAVADFEAVQMGLMAKVGGMGNKRAVVAAENRVTGKAEEDVVVAALGKTVRATDGGKADGEGSRKRKFELDEEELLRIATEDRAKARQALSDEKLASSNSATSFWIPSSTAHTHPASTTATRSTTKPKKPTPLCPGSSTTAPHEISLKHLLPVTFTLENTNTALALPATSSDDTSNANPASTPSVRTCPACSRPLNNAAKAILAKPCGHVVCAPCVRKFILAREDPHADEDEDETGARCFVCSADVSGRMDKGKGKGGAKEGKKERERVRGGLMEISSEGTGFAGGGTNVVKRHGVAFQC